MCSIFWLGLVRDLSIVVETNFDCKKNGYSFAYVIHFKDLKICHRIGKDIWFGTLRKIFEYKKINLILQKKINWRNVKTQTDLLTVYIESIGNIQRVCILMLLFISLWLNYAYVCDSIVYYYNYVCALFECYV